MEDERKTLDREMSSGVQSVLGGARQPLKQPARRNPVAVHCMPCDGRR
jgi:hypothetical protein